jgi:hypothetical protein
MKPVREAKARSGAVVPIKKKIIFTLHHILAY